MGVIGATDKDTLRRQASAPGPQARLASAGTLRSSRAAKAPLAAVSVESHIVATTPQFHSRPSGRTSAPKPHHVGSISRNKRIPARSGSRALWEVRCEGSTSYERVPLVQARWLAVLL